MKNTYYITVEAEEKGNCLKCPCYNPHEMSCIFWRDKDDCPLTEINIHKSKPKNKLGQLDKRFLTGLLQDTALGLHNHTTSVESVVERLFEISDMINGVGKYSNKNKEVG